MRYANESTFDATTDVATRTSRIDWVRNYVYPATRTYTFTEIVAPDAGYVAGIDATARNKQSLESTPPAHAMSGLRLATSQRELRRSATIPLMLDMLKNPDRVAPADNVMIGGASLPAVNYVVGDQTFTVMFDPQSGLPARVRTLDYDNIWGDVTYDLVLSDWRTVDGGVRVATSRKYELNGRPIAEITPARGAGARHPARRRRFSQRVDRRDARPSDRLRCAGFGRAVELDSQRGEAEAGGQAREVRRPHASPHGPRRRNSRVRGPGGHHRGRQGQRRSFPPGAGRAGAP
jgi:hypothetical protein